MLNGSGSCLLTVPQPAAWHCCPHLSEASFSMLPSESMHRLCWPIEEVRPAQGGERGSQG